MPGRASESLGHCQRWSSADPLDEFSYKPSMSKFLTRFRENQSFSTKSALFAECCRLHERRQCTDSRPWAYGRLSCPGTIIVLRPRSILRRFETGRGSMVSVMGYSLRRFGRVRVRSCQTDRADHRGQQSCRDAATCQSSRSCRVASVERKNPRWRSRRRQTG